jgi:hypothetical protein
MEELEAFLGGPGADPLERTEKEVRSEQRQSPAYVRAMPRDEISNTLRHPKLAT